MRTFFRKMARSFVAMMCGWVACNFALWAAYEIWSLASGQPTRDPLAIRVMLAVGVGTWVVIALAWLLIFFPTDLMMADTSKLRQPKNAAVTGLVSGLLVSSLYMLWVVPHSGLVWDGSSLLMSGLFVGAAALTGCVAALVRALMKPAKSLP